MVDVEQLSWYAGIGSFAVAVPSLVFTLWWNRRSHRSDPARPEPAGPDLAGPPPPTEPGPTEPGPTDAADRAWAGPTAVADNRSTVYQAGGDITVSGAGPGGSGRRPGTLMVIITGVLLLAALMALTMVAVNPWTTTAAGTAPPTGGGTVTAVSPAAAPPVVPSDPPGGALPAQAPPSNMGDHSTRPTSGTNPATPRPDTGAATQVPMSATITTPPGDQVPQCWNFAGDATLPAGKALAVGVHNTSGADPDTHFETVLGTRAGSQTWSRTQFFGAGDDSVGQRYTVRVVAVDQNVLDATYRSHGVPFNDHAWSDPDLPAGSQVLAAVAVTRIAGPGAC